MQAGTFVESFQRKMSDLMGRWQREGKLIVFGRARVDSNRLSPECREEMFSVMAESLQKHVVAAANAQIKSTKNLLSLPNAIGLLGVTTPNVKNCPLAFMAAVRTRVLPANLPKTGLSRQNGVLSPTNPYTVMLLSPCAVVFAVSITVPSLLSPSPQHLQSQRAWL